MNFLISSIVAIFFVVVFRNFIKKHSTFCYITATILSILLIIGTYTGIVYTLPSWFTNSIYPTLIKSSFSTALLAIVMYTGAFKNGSSLMKFLMPIRGELSIIASILTLSHNISFGKDHFVRLFTAPQTMEPNMIIAAIISIILITLMIPLMITSFPSIRKKMEPKKWKKLQKTAYLFYALIYVHIMCIMIPLAKSGNLDYKINILIYSLVFLTYAAMRIYKECVKKGLSKQKSLAPIVAATISFALINGYAFYSPSPIIVDANDIIEETTEEEINKEKEIDTKVEEENKTEDNSEDESEISSDSLVIESETNVSSTSDNKNSSSSQVVESNKNSSSNSNKNNNTSSNSNNINTSNNNSSSSNSNNNTTDKENNKTELDVVEPTNSIYKDGVYTGSATGYNGPITVKVTIKNDNIVNVQVTDTTDSEPFISNAISGIINKILSNQSSNVDIVSGATYSSKGIINAVNNALAKAKI